MLSSGGGYRAHCGVCRWISENISFDLDVRVNVFETNIRLLGGLLSAHILASDPRYTRLHSSRVARLKCYLLRFRLDLFPDYNGALLSMSRDLGKRLLAAFGKDSALPYAWVNLKHGPFTARSEPVDCLLIVLVTSRS